jgi:hypothetical protein
MSEVYHDVSSVEVENHRWYSKVFLFDADENVIETLVFSADASLTYNDGIWAGNEGEYKEALDNY